MKPELRTVFTIVLGCLVVVPASSAQSPNRVQVIGQAAGTGPRAGDEALKAAQRRAVEEGCGLYINSLSQTEDFAMIKDRILSQAVGYLRESKELRRWEENGLTYVEISAVVQVADFERDWATFAHVKEDEGNPQMMAIIFEDNDVDDLRPPVTNGICQSRLENFFIGKDVQLVDHRVVQQVRDRELNLAELDNSITQLAAAAAEHRAEVLIIGRAEARRGGTLQLGGKTLYRWDISINIRAVQADSASILMSNTYRPKKKHTSTSSACGDDAFETLIDDVAAEVLRDIGASWHKRTAARRILEVTFIDVPSRRQAKAILGALAEHRGVVNGREGTKIRNFTHGVADTEIDWKFDLGQLADTLEEMKVDGMVFEVTDQTATRITVKVIEGG